MKEKLNWIVTQSTSCDYPYLHLSNHELIKADCLWTLALYNRAKLVVLEATFTAKKFFFERVTLHWNLHCQTIWHQKSFHSHQRFIELLNNKCHGLSPSGPTSTIAQTVIVKLFFIILKFLIKYLFY